MPKRKSSRIPGLRTDPAVADLLRTSVENRAALTQKQRRDRARTKATYDLDPALQQALAAAAKELDTSTSQAVGFFLAYGLDALSRDEPELMAALTERQPARTPRFSWNMVIPAGWQEAVTRWAAKRLPPGWRGEVK